MGKVLFVDDEKMILNAIKRGMRHENFDCLYATSGFEAIRLIGEEDIHVVVTDMKMPEMDGLSLLKEVGEIDKNIVNIVVSGSTEFQKLVDVINLVNVFKYLAKPYDMYTELVPIVREAVAYAKFRRSENQKQSQVIRKNEEYRDILKDYYGKEADIELMIETIKLYYTIYQKHSRVLLMSNAYDKEQVLQIYDATSRVFLDNLKKYDQVINFVESVAMIQDLIDQYNPGINLELISDCNGMIKTILGSDFEGVLHAVMGIMVIKNQDAHNYQIRTRYDKTDDRTFLHVTVETDEGVDILAKDYALIEEIVELYGGHMAFDTQCVEFKIRSY